MSEIQDAVAVVQILGNVMTVSAQLALWLGRHTVDLAACIKAKYDAHKFGRGEISAQQFFKNIQNYEMVSFPDSLLMKDVQNIENDMAKLGITYAWMPVKCKGKAATVVVPKGQGAAVKTLFEQYKPSDDTLSGYFENIDRDNVVFTAQGEYEKLDYVGFKNIMKAKSMNEQLATLNRENKLRNGNWVILDTNNPKNFVEANQEVRRNSKGQMELMTEYKVYRDGKMAYRTSVLNGDEKQMSAETENIIKAIGSSEFAQSYALMSENESGALLKYFVRQFDIFSETREKQTEQEKQKQAREVDEEAKKTFESSPEKMAEKGYEKTEILEPADGELFRAEYVFRNEGRSIRFEAAVMPEDEVKIKQMPAEPSENNAGPVPAALAMAMAKYARQKALDDYKAADKEKAVQAMKDFIDSMPFEVSR